MKKLFKNAFYIMLFVVSGVVFQISCSNSDDSVNSTSTDKLVFYKGNAGGSGFWICDEDGSNQTAVPFVMPSGLLVTTTILTPRLSADGQKILFGAGDNTDHSQNVYSVNIDGSDFHQIITSGANGILTFGGS